MKTEELRSLQAPLKERYRERPRYRGREPCGLRRAGKREGGEEEDGGGEWIDAGHRSYPDSRRF